MSFNGNKTITTGSGGAILVKEENSKKIKAHFYSCKNSKSNRSVTRLHDTNYRMSNTAAALGCAQLENLKKILKAKEKIFFFIKKHLKKLNIFQ